MVMRRPLVRINGQTQQLPTGDSLAGVSLKFPVYQTNTAAVLIDLVAGSPWTLPVYNQAGAAVQVGLS